MNRKIKILHLEDTLNDSELIHSMIEDGGILHDYFLADNEKDYLQILKKENIDLILSDYSLPDYNGNEALKVAREQYSDIPFIFISGTIGEDAAIDAMVNGASDYVLKSKLERLVPAIKRASNEHDLERLHKQAEEALSVSETRYRRLFETAKDGIIILDAGTGMIKDVNPFLIEMLGYSKKQFMEKAIWEIGFFKDIIANRDKFLELQQNEYIRYEDLPLETVDGKMLNVEFVSNVYTVYNQKVIQCNIRDITERKQAERELRRSEDKYRLLIDTAKESIIVAQDGMLKFINPITVSLLEGYSEEELYKIPFANFIHTDDRNMVVENYQQRIANKEATQRYDFRVVTGNGIVKWVELNAALIEWQGRPATLNLLTDITENKLAEEALQASKDYLDKIINTVASPIFVKDDKHKFCMVNDSFCSLIDIPREKLIGNSDMDYFPEEQAIIYIAKDDEVYSTGKENINEEFLTDGKGKIRTIITRKTLYTDPLGNKFLVGVINDITDRRQSEKLLQQSYDNLEIQVQKRTVELADANFKLQLESDDRQKVIEKEKELNLLKNRFISVISHEFRTPLTGIQLSVQLFERYGDKWDTEKKQKFFHSIYNSIRFTNLLLDDVSIIGKDESGKINYNPSPCNIEEVCQLVFDDIKAVFGSTVKINFSIKPEIIETFADDSLLRHILNNILSNAIKYSEPEKQTDFSIVVANDEIIFTITDHGIGIPKEDIKHIFEPFQRASNTESIKGTGLGLAIVKRCIEMHSGSIEIKSTMNIGTTVIVKIPYIKPDNN